MKNDEVTAGAGDSNEQVIGSANIPDQAPVAPPLAQPVSPAPPAPPTSTPVQTVVESPPESIGSTPESEMTLASGSGGSSNKTKQLLIIAGGALVLIGIFVALILSFISPADEDNLPLALRAERFEVSLTELLNDEDCDAVWSSMFDETVSATGQEDYAIKCQEAIDKIKEEVAAIDTGIRAMRDAGVQEVWNDFVEEFDVFIYSMRDLMTLAQEIHLTFLVGSHFEMERLTKGFQEDKLAMEEIGILGEYERVLSLIAGRNR